MRKTMVVLAAASLISTMALAAPLTGEGERGRRGHGEHGHGERGHSMRGHDGEELLERMAERLNLSEAQKLQIRQLHEGFRTQTEPQRTAMFETMKSLREARQAGDTATAQRLAASLEGQFAQMHEIRKAQHERMLALLTPEQRAKVEEMKAEREQRRGERGSRRGGMRHRGPAGL